MGHDIPPGHDIALCTFRVKPGSEQRFEALLARHAPTLRRLGLATAEPSQCFRGLDDAGRPFYFEVLPWTDARAVQTAHQNPEVQAIWNPMSECCEERGGRPTMEFPHAERLFVPRPAVR